MAKELQINNFIKSLRIPTKEYKLSAIKKSFPRHKKKIQSFQNQFSQYSDQRQSNNKSQY